MDGASGNSDKVIGFFLIAGGIVLIRSAYLNETPWKYFRELASGQKHNPKSGSNNTAIWDPNNPDSNTIHSAIGDFTNQTPNLIDPPLPILASPPAGGGAMLSPVPPGQQSNT